jgi:pyridinium-3,5-biscarboxylic acid mononucleotide synthase
VKNEADGQIELLHQILSGEQESQGTPQGKGAERWKESAHPDEETSTSRNAEQSDLASVIETRPDIDRENRKGAPEVIFAETKETSQIIEMAQRLLASTGRAVISRLPREALGPVRERFAAYRTRQRRGNRAMVIYRPDYEGSKTGGHVGVISAGTSDIPVAEEAALLAEEMGCRVTCIYDVGVAGLHRLLLPLRDLLGDGVDVIIVAAGMDGALPSVVAGLVPVPVIGLPTSIGYGIGGKGLAALLSMLQTCAPGLSVVNIDNGVGAGITAGLIANRVAQARGHQSQ